jgi:hypothetical protein
MTTNSHVDSTAQHDAAYNHSRLDKQTTPRHNLRSHEKPQALIHVCWHVPATPGCKQKRPSGAATPDVLAMPLAMCACGQSAAKEVPGPEGPPTKRVSAPANPVPMLHKGAAQPQYTLIGNSWAADAHSTQWVSSGKQAVDTRRPT